MSPIGEVERRSLLRQWADLRQQQERIRARMQMLTPRERQVLDLLYEGQTVRVIAARLGVSESTVRSQVKSVLRKLAVASQLAAVATVDELHTQVPRPRGDAESSIRAESAASDAGPTAGSAAGKRRVNGSFT